MTEMQKIGFGGGCHWCTEAVFQAIKGVCLVEQGFIASNGKNHSFSEGVIVHYDPKTISLYLLVEIHLNTHKSTSAHSMREKYRSAVYYYSSSQKKLVVDILNELNKKFDTNLVTEPLVMKCFKKSPEHFQNYYNSDPERPFCRTYIKPKLDTVATNFSSSAEINSKNTF
ncbi:peptide methionine sulfoxide reductase [Euzebyella marina]|uniref:peptide-methionine (S)-S-oxide reductase n=2 Tax=Euzebyella marina TaxID=1761453 RepID=A0A3G2LAB1_9FLAO|nr:peptide-methionine (S)-S-oxide reductase [Euzebyella marina]AYN69141.1 peptide methionine sulfoxide reductase [Euzebyella marina]